MDKQIFIAAGMIAAAYFLFRFYFLSRKRPSMLEKEIEDVLNSEKYKVKSQYD